MNFTQVFKASASGKMVANYTIDPEILLPNKYESRDTKENALLSLLGGGACKANSSFPFLLPPWQGHICFCTPQKVPAS